MNKCDECKAPAKPARWKVPIWSPAPWTQWEPPHLLCDEHVMGWREWQPENVKALDDDTPWVNRHGERRDSHLKRRPNQPGDDRGG